MYWLLPNRLARPTDFLLRIYAGARKGSFPLTTGGGAEGKARSLAAYLEPVGGPEAAAWTPQPPPPSPFRGPFPPGLVSVPEAGRQLSD